MLNYQKQRRFSKNTLIIRKVINIHINPIDKLFFYWTVVDNLN